MNKAIQERIAKMLESMPEGATYSNLSWADADYNYNVSLSATNSDSGSNWSITASIYKVIPPPPISSPEPMTLPAEVLNTPPSRW